MATERVGKDLGQGQSTMDNDSKEENSDWNRF